MTSGFFGQQLTLMEEIKAATFSAHAGLQGASYFQALAACQLPLESYVGHLRALAAIHGVVEPALASAADPRVAAVWHRGLRKVVRLQDDLRYFEPRTVPDLKEAVAAALATVESLRLRSLAQPCTLLGCLYVLEGSTLGAVVLQPMIARAFLLTGDDGMSFINGYGAGGRARWAEFGQRMNALALSAEERVQVAAAASEFFAQLTDIFSALHPFTPESKTFLVTSINPDAGRHPVPADPREVAAAVRAGDICWARYPYYEHRYGERGRRFARSDAAWQATLCQYEPAQIIQQVRWLGRVLAARGMPTPLLADQLEILVAELSAETPAKRALYEKLLPAAADLAASRRRHLADDQLQSLAAAFDRAVGPAECARLPKVGFLLAAAVADEAGGHPAAVESLCAWLTDATRFSDSWIAAVHATLADARSCVIPLSAADQP